MTLKPLLVGILMLNVVVMSGADIAGSTFGGSRYRHELVGICVQDVTGKEAPTTLNPDCPLVPASVIKLVTTATALELFGPDHCFETTLAYSGTLKNGRLTGDLIIKGGGDPTLGSRHLGEKKDDYLREWVDLVRKAGIQSIDGSVITDASLFDEEPLSPFWLWEDIGNYYAAGIYGLCVNDNSVTVHLRSGKAGTTPSVTKTEPELPLLEFENHLVAADNDKDSAYVYGVPYVWNRQLFGTLPANRSDFSIRGDLPDPPHYAADLLSKALVKSGVPVKGKPATNRIHSLSPMLPLTRIGCTRSLPLSRIIRIIHEKSDNLYAEYVLRSLANVAGSAPYSARKGLDVVRNFWKRKGFDMDGLHMVDGSGLSPLDRVSPRFLADLLTYMSTKSAYAAVFEQSLPLAGREGSVSSFLTDTPITGRVRLKSGSNLTTTCFAGYYQKEATKLAVVMMVNHTNLSRSQVRADMQDFLLNR